MLKIVKEGEGFSVFANSNGIYSAALVFAALAGVVVWLLADGKQFTTVFGYILVAILVAASFIIPIVHSTCLAMIFAKKAAAEEAQKLKTQITGLAGIKDFPLSMMKDIIERSWGEAVRSGYFSQEGGMESANLGFGLTVDFLQGLDIIWEWLGSPALKPNFKEPGEIYRLLVNAHARITFYENILFGRNEQLPDHDMGDKGQ